MKLTEIAVELHRFWGVEIRKARALQDQGLEASATICYAWAAGLAVGRKFICDYLAQELDQGVNP